MGKTCELCGRGPQSGFTRSHSMIQKKRRFNLNLQTSTINGRQKQVCTTCIKTGKKNAAKAEAIKKARA